MMLPNALRRPILAAALAVLSAVLPASGVPGRAVLAQPSAEPFRVTEQEIDDLKAVFGTVQSVHTVVARTRLGGTISRIDIVEGDWVQEGQQLGLVQDDKLPLQLAALDAQLQALQAEAEQARLDLERTQQLRRAGAASQSRLDDAQTALHVVTAQLAARRAERQVVVEQQSEGAVLAPSGGRILHVRVVNGAVVLPGEAVATIAADRYVLRLYLPERHARSIRQGDPVLVGAAGLGGGPESLREGAIRLVYPEMDQGRVVADVTVAGLGDFFVGERTRVYVSTGRRQVLAVPAAYVYSRFGLDYVRLQSGEEVAVRTGLPVRRGPVSNSIEILSGLRPGDVIVPPPGAAAPPLPSAAAPAAGPAPATDEEGRS